MSTFIYILIDLSIQFNLKIIGKYPEIIRNPEIQKAQKDFQNKNNEILEVFTSYNNMVESINRDINNPVIQNLNYTEEIKRIKI